MSNLLESLLGQMDANTLQKMAGQLGANPEQVQSAISQALPILTKAMAQNASTPEGAASLHNALSKDHDGSILDSLDDFLGNWQNGPGAGIMKHVLGNQQEQVVQHLGVNSGLSGDQAGGLLQILGPLLMGGLGKQQRSGGLDAGGIFNILKGVLGGAGGGSVLSGGGQPQQQQSAGNKLGVLGNLIDRDHDGNVADDLLDMGKGFLGNLLKKK